jgi:hypothetical protein
MIFRVVMHRLVTRGDASLVSVTGSPHNYSDVNDSKGIAETSPHLQDGHEGESRGHRQQEERVCDGEVREPEGAAVDEGGKPFSQPLDSKEIRDEQWRLQHNKRKKLPWLTLMSGIDLGHLAVSPHLCSRIVVDFLCYLILLFHGLHQGGCFLHPCRNLLLNSCKRKYASSRGYRH